MGLFALSLVNPPLVYAVEVVSVFEQSYPLNLQFKNEEVGKIIEKISEQSGVKIVYSNAQIDTKKRITITIKTSDIKEALGMVLGDNYMYRQIENYISVARKKEDKGMEAPQQQKQQKKRSVTGLITDGDGNPVIGATVMVKGTTQGVTSDLDGNYTLNDVSPGATLVFRYIGHNVEERVLKEQTNINVRMTESSVGLEDVVVIGYGQQKKNSVVASLNSIGPAELNVKQRNLRNSIAGQIAGVIAVQRSGEPGNDAAAFYIRGQSSYAGGTSPLVIVDGIPRGMDDIDVDEIESFTVLKDAAATAVYGAEGANGVVLITSKRGKVQKTTMNFTAQYSVITPNRLPELMDAYRYLSLWNEAVWNDQGNPNEKFFIPDVSNEILNKYKSGVDPDMYPSVNWMDLLNEHTQSQRYTINFRGGSERNRFFASGSYYSEDGIFKSNPTEKYDANIGLQRFNLRSNIDMDLTKTTLLSVDMSGQYLRKNNPGFSSDEIFEYIVHFPTHVIPMYYSDGTASDHGSNGWGRYNQPYNMLNNSGYTKTWNAFIQSKVTLDQKLNFITDGLSIKGTISFDADFTSTMKRSKTPKTYNALRRDENGALVKKVMKEGSPLGDPWKEGTSGSKKIYMEASLNYQHTFAQKHDVTGLLLYMQKETQYQDKEGVQLLPYRKQSMVGRATYGYDDRYMFEASVGITGSENFASGHRWGMFPAVGVAWFVSHEKLMRGIEDYINKLKIRASVGVTGNDNIGYDTRFPYRGSINTGASGYNFGLTPGANGGASNWLDGIVEGTFNAPNLSWEKERKINVGADFGFFRGRVDISFDYFSNRRDNILIQRETLPSATGFRSKPFQNFGVTTNKGVDASIILKQNIGEVSLSARGNITYAKNKIVERDEIPQPYPWLLETGNAIGQPKLYIAEGLYTPDDFDIQTDPANGAQKFILKDHLPKPSANVSPGDIKYKDLNNDHVIDSYDMTYKNGYYPSLPEIVYGFGLNAEWKGFFVGVFFQGVAHTSTNMISNITNIVPFTIGRDNTSARTEVLNRWRADDPYNQDVFFPRMHSSEYTHNTSNSTWWYRDAGFLRLKNIEIGYEFDKKLLQNIKIQNLRIYLQGNNVAVWDKVKYWDPELGNAASGAKYPLSSTNSIGLEVTL